MYPNALKILENKTKPADVVIWAVLMLGKIGMCSDSKLHGEIKDKLTKAHFNDAVEPESKAADGLLTSILAHKMGPEPVPPSRATVTRSRREWNTIEANGPGCQGRRSPEEGLGPAFQTVGL
jgi:hypothetical protein